MIKLVILVLLFPIITFAQSEKTHIGNAADNPNAILQIDSDSRGMLISKLTTAQRNAIGSPAEGLLVYDVNTQSFWYHQGAKWVDLNRVSNLPCIAFNTAKLQVEEGQTDDDKIQFTFGDFNAAITGEQLHFNDDTQVIIEQTTDIGFNYYSNESTHNNSLRTGEYDSAALRGINSVAIGKNVIVTAENGLAFGGDNGSGSIQALVSGKEGTHFGHKNIVAGENGFAMGNSNFCAGNDAVVWGFNNEANGNAAMTWGSTSKAVAANATAWGFGAQANNALSTAFGNGAIADGVGSMAWNEGEAAGNYSFCWGQNTKAYTQNEICMGTASEVYDPSSPDGAKLFVVAGGNLVNVPAQNLFQVFKNNTAMYKGDLTLRTKEPENILTSEEVIFGLKEETNGVLFGFEFELTNGNGQLDLWSKSFSGNEGIRMTVNTSGDLGFGLFPITNLLEVNGNASKSTAGPWLANSDKRLKKNIVNMDKHEILSKVLEMKPVTFEWDDNGKTPYDRPEGIQYGFIAQDLAQVWPTKVSVDGRGYLQTAYGDFDPIYIGAFKAQQKTINKIELANIEIIAAERAMKIENEKLLTELAEIEKLIAKMQVAAIE